MCVRGKGKQSGVGVGVARFGGSGVLCVAVYNIIVSSRGDVGGGKFEGSVGGDFFDDRSVRCVLTWCVLT